MKKLKSGKLKNEYIASHFSAIIESSMDAIFSKDLDGYIISWNKGAKLMYGYSAEEIIGRHISTLVPQELTEEFSSIMLKIKNGESISNLETIRVKKDKEKINVSLTISPIRDSEGKIIAASTIGHNITQQKQAEEALKISEQKYKNIFEFSPIGIYTSNYKGQILTANLAFAKILGCCSVEEVLKLNLADDVYFDKKERSKLISQYKNTNSVVDIEVQWKKKSGEPLWVELNVHTVKDIGGCTLYFEGFVRDITNHKLRKEQLLFAKEKAEKSDRLKTEFLTRISHEIRTPLNNILTYTSILKEEFEDKLPEGMESAFYVIDNSSQRLIRTIELILNLSRVQTGNFETKFEVLDLHKDLLEDLNLEFFSRAKMKNLYFIYKNNSNNALIYADKYSLSQVFINLIDNAIKYTEKGGIQMIINELSNKICVSISDTGIGISPEYIPNVFNPFSQEDYGPNRIFQGTGLGLALVKRYVEINKAEIKVFSEKWKGSTFTVMIPPVER